MGGMEASGSPDVGVHSPSTRSMWKTPRLVPMNHGVPVEWTATHWGTSGVLTEIQTPSSFRNANNPSGESLRNHAILSATGMSLATDLPTGSSGRLMGAG